jgi:hypothetical protein
MLTYNPVRDFELRDLIADLRRAAAAVAAVQDGAPPSMCGLAPAAAAISAAAEMLDGIRYALHAEPNGIPHRPDAGALSPLKTTLQLSQRENR